MKLRPRYRIEVDNLNSDEARAIIQKAIEKENMPLEVESTPYYLHVFMPENERKLWTPHIAITFEDREPGCIIRANIGPSSKIWLPFMFVYMFLAVAILFVLIYGFTQVSLNQQATILYSLIPMGAIVAGMYLMSYLGQQKSASCLIIFRRILQNSFENYPSLVSFDLKQ